MDYYYYQFYPQHESRNAVCSVHTHQSETMRHDLHGGNKKFTQFFSTKLLCDREIFHSRIICAIVHSVCKRERAFELYPATIYYMPLFNNVNLLQHFVCLFFFRSSLNEFCIAQKSCVHIFDMLQVQCGQFVMRIASCAIWNKNFLTHNYNQSRHTVIRLFFFIEYGCLVCRMHSHYVCVCVAWVKFKLTRHRLPWRWNWNRNRKNLLLTLYLLCRL